jgi:L-rhamnose mutarotase
MNQIYTKKSSEKHFWTKITDRNNRICSLVRSDKKMQKLWTAILKCRTVIFEAEARTCSFKEVFLLELRDFNTPSFKISLD